MLKIIEKFITAQIIANFEQKRLGALEFTEIIPGKSQRPDKYRQSA